MGKSTKLRKKQNKQEAMRAALRAILTHRGRSPISVSDEAGVSQSAVNDILNGRIPNPSLETLQSIAAVLQVPVAQIIGEGDILLAPAYTEHRIPVEGFEHS